MASRVRRGTKLYQSLIVAFLFTLTFYIKTRFAENVITYFNDCDKLNNSGAWMFDSIYHIALKFFKIAFLV